MTTELVEVKIQEAVAKSAPFAVDMIAGWIRDSITDNKFIVTEMKQATFNFVSNNKMSFVALVKAHIGTDFEESIIAKVIWEKDGRNISRKFVNT